MDPKKEQIAYIAGAVVAVLLLAGGIYLLVGEEEIAPAPVTPVVEEVIVAPVAPPAEVEPEAAPQPIEYTNKDDLADDVTRIVIEESETNKGGPLDKLLDGKVVIHDEVVGEDGEPMTMDSGNDQTPVNDPDSVNE